MSYLNSGRFSRDGLILVKCYICGSDIGYFPYTGYSTAICILCQNPEAIVEAELKKGEDPTIVEKVSKVLTKAKDDVADMVNNIGRRVTGVRRRTNLPPK